MITTIFITGIALFVLYGLISSTEKVLSDRKKYVVIDERIVDHRSRL
ncbi:MAG: hypothetical protein L6Q49_17140 [Anaerolineales bacterium]|nr:hypothetical protein [Anaerolineales bacterium]